MECGAWGLSHNGEATITKVGKTRVRAKYVDYDGGVYDISFYKSNWQGAHVFSVPHHWLDNPKLFKLASCLKLENPY